MSEVESEQPVEAPNRFRRLSPTWRAIAVLSTTIAVSMAIYQLYNLGHYTGFVAVTEQYEYALLAILLPFAFIYFPFSRSASFDSVPIYDIVLGLAAFGICAFLAYSARDIIDGGWEYAAPDYIKIVGAITWVLVLEASRRAGGWAIFSVVFIVSIYPVFGNYAPGIFEAAGETWGDTAAYHVVSNESLLGIPMRAFANLVLGFLIFGVALQYTGGGQFFLNLAFALLGHVRGGPAKVAIFASGLMGSMSGSVITNVLTTGVMSIPAMRRVGFAPHYAGGVEACASTGGVLMPPIMGATAFVMATFLEVPYIDIAIAAVIPSVLYFFGLFVQIDSYAAKMDLKGLPREELPTLADTFKDGWHFVLVFVLLIWMLVYLQQEALAPFYATGLLIAVNQFKKDHRWGWQELLDFAEGTGKLFAELAAILAGIGLVIGAFSFTGIIGSLANDLISLAGGNIIVLLIMGAVTSFIMGIGMTVTAAYIFLAITLAPALTNSGLTPMAVHMFMLYWGMLSFITPPVALGAFAAASLAKSNPMRTGFEAMRLGSIIYFIPFFFVLNPALIMQGDGGEIFFVTSTALVGVIFIAGSLQGYLLFVGNVTHHPIIQWPIRILLFVAGMLFAIPGNHIMGVTNTELTVAGAICAGLGILLVLPFRKPPGTVAA